MTEDAFTYDNQPPFIFGYIKFKSKEIKMKANLFRNLQLFFCSAIALQFFVGAQPSYANVIYVVDHYDSTILRYDSSGGPGTVFGSVVSPTGIAADRDGNIYVASEQNTIIRFTPGGVSSVFARGLNGPWGMAFDTSGNLYVANGDDTIRKVSPDGVVSTFATCTSYAGPISLAFDGAGNLYVAEGKGLIEEFDPQGNRSVFATTSVIGPFGLAINSAGDVFMSNQTNPTIMRYGPGGVETPFGSLPSGYGYGLAFDSSDLLYAVSSDGNVYTFDSNGVRTEFATGLPDRQLFIAVVPVPEPAPLFLLGLGLAFALLLNKRYEPGLN